jgi:hypothetical protein
VTEVPLVVDLDGTLTTSDTLRLQLQRLVRRAPLSVPTAIRMLAGSRSAGKEYLWKNGGLDVLQVRYSPTLVALLLAKHDAGVPIILATGATQGLANAISEYFGIFRSAFGSSSNLNLTGARKAAFLTAQFGVRGFDYAGNATADIAVWEKCRRAVICNASRATIRRASDVARVEIVIDDRRYRGPNLLHGLAS